MKVCHLILKHKYYDAIQQERKKVEYRKNIPYWRKRILDCDHVTFHKGYSNITMTFEIAYKTLNGPQIEIHLGKFIH